MRISDGVQTCALPISSIDPSKAFIGSQASRGSWSTSPTRRHHGAIGRGCAETPPRHLKFFHPVEAFVCPLSCPDEERPRHGQGRSDEHTSELQSLMRHSSAVFCLTKKHTSKSQSLTRN